MPAVLLIVLPLPLQLLERLQSLSFLSPSLSVTTVKCVIVSQYGSRFGQTTGNLSDLLANLQRRVNKTVCRAGFTVKS